MRVAVAPPLALLLLSPLLCGPAWSEEIATACGPDATGVIQVGPWRSCLGPSGRALGPEASAGTTVRFVGTSHADSLLRADTAQSLLFLVAARGCTSVQTITMRVISDRPQNVSQGRRWWKEGWSAKGCRQTFPYTVLFHADGKGGTDFSLSPAP